MKVLALLGLLVFFVSAVIAQSGSIDSNYLRHHDNFQWDDAEEDPIAEHFDGIFFEDEDGNYIEVNFNEDGEENETIAETQADLANRVFFYLYTQDNPASPDLIYPSDTTALASSHFDASKPTRIITHGWVNSYKSDACVLIRDAYLAHGDYNVIVVDWSSIAKRPYMFSSRRVYIVGGYIAQLIDFLETQGMDLSELLLVGHSLGGHIVGLAGHQTTNTVGYIVGLDPAAPYFWFSGPGARISQSDAAYVQIIHTNAGVLGYSGAIGDVDFYPNGGSRQRGCIIDPAGSCSHARAYKYFAESINSETQFVGTACRSWLRWLSGFCGRNSVTYMGGSTPTTSAESGSYFLRTNRGSAYARG